MFLTLLVGSFVNNQEVEMVEELNYIDQEYIERKYSVFRAWKWYTVLFQLSLTWQVINALCFWTFVFSLELLHSLEIQHQIYYISNYTIPLILVLIDFSCNVVPFGWRHLPSVNLVGIIYLIINFLVHLLTGRVVTEHFDWSTREGFMFIGGSIIVYNLIFVLVKFLSDVKLRRNGYSNMVNSLRDEFHIKKT